MMKQQISVFNIYCLLLLFCVFGMVCNGSTAEPIQRAFRAVSTWDAHLSPEDRRMKHCKMSVSPFVFYRGSNHLFWDHFANDARLAQFGNPRTRIWIQGDLHAENFGAYENAEGTVVYDLNDFDESVIADYQYDLWRMAISLLLLARQNALVEEGVQSRILDAFGEGYLDALQEADEGKLETRVVFSKKNSPEPLKGFLERTEKKQSRQKMLKKWTQKSEGERHFDFSLEELERVPPDSAKEIEKALSDCAETLDGSQEHSPGDFGLKSLARRLDAGTGSFGTPRYYALIEGEDDTQEDDRILDIKRQGRPTPYTFLGKAFQKEYTRLFANDAQRHALAYRSLSLHTELYSGWMRLVNGVYSVRERSPYKASFPTETLSTEQSFRKMAAQWGRILAFAHARADRDSPGSMIDYSFEREILNITKKRDEEFLALIRTIAFEYAEQVEADWRDFVEGVGESCRQ